MPGGRINTRGKLESWSADPTRDTTPPEPNYLNDAERFRDRLDKKIEAKLKQQEVKRKQQKGTSIKTVGRGQKTFVVKDLNFVFKYSTYKGKTLKFVMERDPQFVRNFVNSKDYEFSDSVKKALMQKGIIK